MWKHGDFGIWYDIVPLVMSSKYKCSEGINKGFPVKYFLRILLL
jgi:hypothetical protein